MSDLMTYMQAGCHFGCVERQDAFLPNPEESRACSSQRSFKGF